MEIKLEVIQILEDKLFNNSFVKGVYHFKDTDDCVFIDNMLGDYSKFNRLIEIYKIDNLGSRYYREIYDENYPDLEKNNPDYYDKLERENRLPNTSWCYSTMPLGLYDPCNDEIILDMNSIYKCADDNNFVLKPVV